MYGERPHHSTRVPYERYPRRRQDCPSETPGGGKPVRLGSNHHIGGIHYDSPFMQSAMQAGCARSSEVMGLA